jgi:hypothetical protein
LRSFAFVLLLAVVAVPAVRAQSADEPSLAFTISGGLTTGGKLWRIDAQPLTAPGASQDTVGLARRLLPGVAASLGISLFRSPHVGINGEIGYFSLSGEQACVPPANGYQPSTPAATNLNPQACTTANGLRKATSVIAFLGGFMFRPSSTAHVQPFLRANAGLALLNNSFIETIGIVHDTSCVTNDDICFYTLLSEQRHVGASWIVSLAGGVSFDLGPGYRVRMEGRDLMLSIPTVSGPATPGGTFNYAPTNRVVRHVPVFMIGFDVLLEQRRTRRY